MKITGHRGKSAFAKMLGLSPSTYDYYEAGRVPPAEVLVNIADVADVDLRWLLTGQTASTKVRPDHPVLRRAAELLGEHPDADKPLAAFLDVLAESMKFPAKAPGREDERTDSQPEGSGSPRTGRGSAKEEPEPAERPAPDAEEDWVPVLGRSAAGVPQFWSPDDPAEGVTELREIVDRVVSRSSAQQRRPAVREEGRSAPTAAQIISLSTPDQNAVSEFVTAGAVRREHPDTFAVRLDGESMSPELRHGDLVLLSPSAPAVSGKPAVVQLARQIGVTCKIYRREGDTVHLIAINEQFPPEQHPAERVVWALRVLGKVRPATRRQ